MISPETLSRRSFLAAAGAATAIPASAKKKKLPVGLELYSVRDELKQDLVGTVRAVAKIGYEGVEFYAPYFDWTPEYARQVRRLLDDSGIRCFSTHNGAKSFLPENIAHAIEINQIIGSKYIIMASAGQVQGIDGWKKVAETLTATSEKLKPLGLRTGFHNHKAEFVATDGKRPMDVLATGTPKDVVLQLDVGACLEAGADPIVWIKSNPGRIVSMHCKDWSPDAAKGYRVLIGEGAVPWKNLLRAAEKTGGIEYYLVEQEGSDYPPIDTAARCLVAFRRLHNS
ncbi:MAG: sugar phosphate isomerase/epimerase [Bryobacteraceae bacterium]